MPIYEFTAREKCGRKIEVFGQTVAETQPPKRALREEQTFTRLFSTFAAHGSASDVPIAAWDQCGNHSGGCSCCHG